MSDSSPGSSTAPFTCPPTPDLPGIPPEKPLTGWRALLWTSTSSFAIFTIGSLGKLWLRGLNNTFVYGLERLLDCVEKREEGRPLITVSNHCSTVDDPFLFGLLPLRVLARPRMMRWNLGAADICFTRPTTASFITLGKIVPVIRGAGVYQRGVDFVLGRLDVGDWVHLFPEGRVNATREWMRIKWGVGRLVAEARIPPLVLPFWHEGMEEVLPLGKPYIPRIGRRVTVVFGDVIDTRELLEKLKSQPHTSESLRKAVTDYIQTEMKRLRDMTRSLHFPHEPRRRKNEQPVTMKLGPDSSEV